MKIKFVILSTILAVAVVAAGCSKGDVTDELYLDNLHSENITLGGATLLIPAYGEIHLTAAVNVTTTNASLYYPVVGNTTSGELKGFSNNGSGRLTYTDTAANRVCLINIAFSLSGTNPNLPNTVTLQLYKNGIAVASSIVQDALTVQDRVEFIPSVSLITLISSGDYLELQIKSTEAGAILTVNTVTIIATTVD